MRCQGSDRGEVLLNGIRTKGSGSPPSSDDAGWIQKTNRRGKAPYCVAASGDEGPVSTWRKCGQVRFAKRPCAGIEETGEPPSDAGEMECSRRRKVHSLI